MDILNLLIKILLIPIFYFIGTKIIEKRHYRSIQKREEELLNLPAVTLKELGELPPIKEVKLVVGSVVISIDYFKRVVLALKRILGGEVTSLEPIVDRARREAILRMKEQAKGADLILNVRIETSNIGSINPNNYLACSEIIAYGTAITFVK